MKNLILILCVIALASCATPKATVDSITYLNGSAIIKGKVIVTIPTQAQADSLLENYTKNIVRFIHVTDSANVHTYEYILTTPPLQLNK